MRQTFQVLRVEFLSSFADISPSILKPESRNNFLQFGCLEAGRSGMRPLAVFPRRAMSRLEIERDGTAPFRPGFTASEKAVYPRKIKLNAPGRAVDIARVQIAPPCFVTY